MSTAELFFEAIQQGKHETVANLVASEPDLANAHTAAGLSAVLLAAYYQKPEIAELLIEHGAKLTLFEAASVGHLETVKSILAADPDLVSAYAADGFYPLGLAAFFGHDDVVTFLLQQGADIQQSANNPQRVNALHAATANRHLAISRRLLEHGIDVNAVQQAGFTPLHAAAQNGQKEMVNLLLEYGANVDAQADDGQTALDIARTHNHPEVAYRLEAAGQS